MNTYTNFSYMISHIFLMLFFYLFAGHRFSRRKTIIICLSSFLLITATDSLKLNLFPNSGLCYVVVTLFQIFVTQFTGIFISKTRDSKVLFMGLSASNYVIVGSIAFSILHIYTDNIFLSLIGSFIVHLVILLFLYFRIRSIWLKCYEREYMNSWWELCLIPVFFYCGFCFLAFFPNTLYEHPENILATIIFVITMFVSYVVVLRYVISESSRAGTYWKNVLFESYIKGLENQYYLVEQAEQNLKILRHDMRHYSNMINSLLAQKEYDEIRKITEHINDVADDNKITRYCENIIINSIMSEIMEKARTLDVDIQPDLRIPKELPVNDYEFASVVNNLLENALICVSDLVNKEKYVRAKIHCSQEYLLVQVKNEYEKEIIFDPYTGLPRSRKGENHGLGMQSVSAFSNKIGGNIGCYCENGTFNIVIFAKF